ncbi:MAG: C10 family peptidase [Duncaniella sp.]|nr:C10 family peptidase [Duncaniella sp.]
MKKTFTAILLGAVAAVPSVMGAPLSPDEALARMSADRLLSSSIHKAPASDFRLTDTVGNLYIFSGKTGFVVLPDDDAAPALLGYSCASEFDADVNPNLAYWLECLNQEIDYLKSVSAVSATRAPRVDRPAIAPMIATRWNQDSPYNNDCPVIGGRRSVTGCVATAMAQVLKYHGYPESGTGVVSYTLNGQNLSFDYGNTTFEWDLMTDTYDSSSSTESQAAVATLMYACGVGVNMQYSPQSSGASSAKIPGTLIDNFNYDKSIWLAQRNAFGLVEWEELIYSELKEGRPVLYGGQGSGGGHEFVCDGYSDNGYFHFNWGWGGMSDGYFLLTALNPGSLGTGGGAGGYNMDQDVVIGVQPARADSHYTYMMYNIENFNPQETSATSGSYFSFSGGFMNGSAVTIPGLKGGIKFLRTDDNSVRYVEALNNWGNLPPTGYYQSMTVKLPSDLAEGDYVVTPAYSYEGGQWEDMHSYATVTGKQFANVEGNTIKFTAPPKATVNVTDITTMSEIYAERLTPLSFTVTNPGSEEFIGEIVPSLFDAGGKLVAESDPIPLDLIGGASQQFSDVTATFLAVSGADFVPGNYSLVFCDGDGNHLSEAVDVTVAANPGAASVSTLAFDLVSPTVITDKSSVKFKVEISCTQGYFSNSLQIVIFPNRSGSVSSVYSQSTPVYYLNAGQSESKEAEINLSSLDNGQYFAMLYLGSSPASNKQILFELTNPTTGIESIAGNLESAGEIYNLSGVKCSRPLVPGIYIINGIKTLVK